MSDAAWEPLIRSGLFPPPERLPPSQGGPLPPSQGGPSRLLGHMLRNSSIASGTAVGKRAPAWMAGLVHYRLVPGSFPHGMRYHFDGLAEVIRFSFDATGDGGPQSAPSLTWRSMPFESDAFERYQSCLFFGTGTGPTAGAHLCFTNPGVNLLPLRGPGAEQQLWLTIDTASWGRVDPQTLATLPGRAVVDSLVLNAHPACDGTCPGRVHDMSETCACACRVGAPRLRWERVLRAAPVPKAGSRPSARQPPDRPGVLLAAAADGGRPPHRPRLARHTAAEEAHPALALAVRHAALRARQARLIRRAQSAQHQRRHAAVPAPGRGRPLAAPRASDESLAGALERGRPLRQQPLLELLRGPAHRRGGGRDGCHDQRVPRPIQRAELARAHGVEQALPGAAALPRADGGKRQGRSPLRTALGRRQREPALRLPHLQPALQGAARLPLLLRPRALGGRLEVVRPDCQGRRLPRRWRRRRVVGAPRRLRHGGGLCASDGEHRRRRGGRRGLALGAVQFHDGFELSRRV
mmetsp:Transcript_34001/g.108518  ORF Transcript_34001/g.108518 Transcript_34001/m.108518 type:complete len:523 (-) Transcript_34001:205-1773(-)